MDVYVVILPTFVATLAIMRRLNAAWEVDAPKEERNMQKLSSGFPVNAALRLTEGISGSWEYIPPAIRHLLLQNTAGKRMKTNMVIVDETDLGSTDLQEFLFAAKEMGLKVGCSFHLSRFKELFENQLNLTLVKSGFAGKICGPIFNITDVLIIKVTDNSDITNHPNLHYLHRSDNYYYSGYSALENYALMVGSMLATELQKQVEFQFGLKERDYQIISELYNASLLTESSHIYWYNN